MQSYISYKVSEFLRDRHPYIPSKEIPEYPYYTDLSESERPVPLIDPEEVAIAYNERCIPKLSDLLVYKPLSPEKRRDALHTLNELVSHQETKVLMLNNDILTNACNLMADSNSDVRFEAAILVGSLLFLDVGRKQFNSSWGNYEILHNLIFDRELKVREAIGWLLYRFTLHKDGILMMVGNKTITVMVEAFKKYSEFSNFAANKYYLIYLLEAFINITMYDYGILPMLNMHLLFTFNSYLVDFDDNLKNSVTNGLYEQIVELILNSLKNITQTKAGKSEAITEGLIYTVSNFLTSDKENERLFSSSFMMSIVNNLDAKKQICNKVNGNGKFEILEVKYLFIQKICTLLSDKNPDIKNNAILGLRILSELPDGFLKIVDIINEHLTLLDEVNFE
jgi:hypothetical protein